MILVFGKNGQVGGELGRFPGIRSSDRLSADLSRPGQCFDAIHRSRPDAVINSAAYTDVDRAETELELALQVNCNAPFEMARACYELDIPLLHISTEFVFDGQLDRPYFADDFANPINAYGVSKHSGEQALAFSPAQIVILRTSWVFSDMPRGFVHAIKTKSQLGKDLPVVCDQIGGPTPAHDLADAAIKIVSQMIDNKALRGTYHFAGYPNISRADFARSILQPLAQDALIKDISTAELGLKVKRPLNSRLDCQKTVEDLGLIRPDWRKLFNIKQSIDGLVA